MAGASKAVADSRANLPFVYRQYSAEQLKQVLHKMYLIRRFEEGAEECYTRGLIHGTMHLSIGQEASAMGICMPLAEDDQITSTHRGHGHCNAKGAEVKRMFAEFFGKTTGYCKGRGGSMHIALTSAPFAPALKASFPQIEEAVRIDPEGGGIIQHGSSNLKVDDMIVADKSLFQIFSYEFLEGNAATALEDPQSIVITEILAKTLFG